MTATPRTALRAITAAAPELERRAFIAQEWRDVVFLHWRVDTRDVAPLLPPGTRPDEHDGSSWVGLIGFVLADTAFPPLPPMRRLGTFVEVNVRLYTTDDAGRRGVLFRSLEASRLPPVLAANAALGLPYRWAAATQQRDGDELGYRTRRRAPGRPSSAFSVGLGAPLAEPTELETFLTARWGMHVRRFGRTRFWPNVHEPWRLRRAELRSVSDRLVAAAGLPGVTRRPPDSVLAASTVHARFATPARDATA